MLHVLPPGTGLADAGDGGKMEILGVSDQFAAGEFVVPVARRKVGERREAAKQPGPGPGVARPSASRNMR